MRARRHEIKLRLNDREFTQLNDMVAQSIFSREEFIRMVLAGYQIQESPREYLQFRHEILHRLDEIYAQVCNRPITDETLKEIKRIHSEIGRTLNQIAEIYMPYYRMRREDTDERRESL